MKINTLHLASFFCIYGTLASIIVGAMDVAFAESTVPIPDRSVLNGLYSPTASEIFFEEGKRKIERETKILVNPRRYKKEGILKNNIVDTKIEELEQENPILNFPNNGLQQ